EEEPAVDQIADPPGDVRLNVQAVSTEEGGELDADRLHRPVTVERWPDERPSAVDGGELSGCTTDEQRSVLEAQCADVGGRHRLCQRLASGSRRDDFVGGDVVPG